MNLLHFFYQNRFEVLQLIYEHLSLVFISTTLAIIIGVPLGITISRWQLFTRPILGFANIMQTIPSLALFGFLIPFSGIGPKTAILSLFLYALLPIIQNTYIGIQEISPSIREAGIGMGMTHRQRLISVEIPLALAFIISGIRIATVISVGTATIAAAIDAGGLGRYIFRGLRMGDNTLILAGAIPVALIALSADLFFGLIEKGLKKWKKFRKTFKYYILFFLLFGTLLFALYPNSRREFKIAIGAKDFTEQIILGELIATVIERKTNYLVDRHFDLGGTLAHQALLSGQIDAYVEYTGTALTAILHSPLVKNPQAVYAKVKDEYAKRFNLIWTEPFSFNNTFAILVRKETAEKFKLKNISDLTKYAHQLTAGFGQDFMSREDGYKGLVELYQLKFKDIHEMDLSFIYRAIESQEVDVVVGNSTDGLIQMHDLIILVDDQNYFPPYEAAAVVRSEIYPKIKTVLADLGGLISLEEMRALNFQVEVEQSDPHKVIEDFLQKKEIH